MCRLTHDLNEQEILDANPIRTCVLCDEQIHEEDMYDEWCCVSCNERGVTIGAETICV